MLTFNYLTTVKSAKQHFFPKNYVSFEIFLLNQLKRINQQQQQKDEEFEMSKMPTFNQFVNIYS